LSLVEELVDLSLVVVELVDTELQPGHQAEIHLPKAYLIYL
jgi:hypothetical protein